MTSLAVPVLRADVTLTDAQIKALPAGPIEVDAAPGAGKLIHFLSAVALCTKAQGAWYTNIAEFPWVQFQVGNQAVSAQAINDFYPNVEDWLTAAGTTVLRFSPVADVLQGGNFPLVVPQTTDTLALENQPLRFVMNNGASGNLTGGDPANSAKLVAFYTVIDL